eukprot:maker-scaffold_2-snap-gene-2.22-mRNA-1 protein AED:0.00 eAED:0.00 QI:231/1/1/1/1/1/2/475/607
MHFREVSNRKIRLYKSPKMKGNFKETSPRVMKTEDEEESSKINEAMLVDNRKEIRKCLNPWKTSSCEEPVLSFSEIIQDEEHKRNDPVYQLEQEEEMLKKALELSLKENNPSPRVENISNSENLDDFALAMQLQEEENNLFHQQQSHRLNEQRFLGQKIHLGESSNEISDSSPLLMQQYHLLSKDHGAESYFPADTERKKKDNRAPYFRNKDLKGQGGDEEIITKHDKNINELKSTANLVKNLPFEFKSGNLFIEKRINHKVYNALQYKVKKQSGSVKGSGTTVEKDQFQTQNSVLDGSTRLNLQKYVNKGQIKSYGGAIKGGKESLILSAIGIMQKNEDEFDLRRIDEEEEEAREVYEKEIAVKVFKTSLNEFKNRTDYVQGDFRFSSVDRLSHQNNRKVVKVWAEKEYKNLIRLSKLNVPCPKPYLLGSNYIFMQFLGRKSWPSPQLKETNLSRTSYAKTLIECIFLLRALYAKCDLVHADFSEYNVIYHEKKCYVIDLGQAVLTSHPNAEAFLRRDCKNIVTFYTKRFLFDDSSLKQDELPEVLYNIITKGKVDVNENELEGKNHENEWYEKTKGGLLRHVLRVGSWSEGLINNFTLVLDVLFN